MDPVSIGMLALGGGSLLSGIFGQNQQAKLAKQQLAQQQAEFAAQKQLADQQLRLSQAGSTDSYGNQLQYDPITNQWNTKLSQSGQQIQDANTGEQLRELQYDAPLARGQEIANAAAATQAGQGANTAYQQLMDKLSGKTSYNANDVAGSLAAGRYAALGAGFNEADKNFNTNATRTGMSIGAIADAKAQAGQSNANYAAQAMGNPTLDGVAQAQGMNNTDQGAALDTYNQLSSRASQTGGFSYTPSTQSSALATSLANARNGSISGASAASGNLNTAAGIQQNGWNSTAGATVPNYNGVFNQAGSLLQGYAANKAANSATLQAIRNNNQSFNPTASSYGTGNVSPSNMVAMLRDGSGVNLGSLGG